MEDLIRIRLPFRDVFGAVGLCLCLAADPGAAQTPAPVPGVVRAPTPALAPEPVSIPAPAPKPPAKPAPAPDRWDMSAELSLTDQSGNRVLQLFTGGLKVSHREKKIYRLDGRIQSRYGKSEGEVVARNHYASLAFDLHPEGHWSPFLSAEAERDEFKRLDLRFNGGAGASYIPYRTKDRRSEATLSLALLYSHENLSPSTQGAPEPEPRNFARWNLRVQGKQQVQPGVTLNVLSLYQPVWDEMADYLLRTETGAKVLLTKRLALSVEYQLNRNAQPPEGVGPNDRLLKTGLIIDF